MKMIMAIVGKQDARTVVTEMAKKSFTLTRLSSSGGFLKGSTVTLVCVVHAERVKEALDVLKSTCKSRKYDISRVETGIRSMVDASSVVVVGGATVFVLNVEENYKF